MQARFKLYAYDANGRLVYTAYLDNWAEVDEETAEAESNGYTVKVSW